MTGRQRENTAKYSYDLSKIVLTVAGATNAFSEHVNPPNLWMVITVGVEG